MKFDFNNNNRWDKEDIKVVMAVALTVFSLILIAVALFLPVLGEVHTTVITVLTILFSFVASILGIDAHYTYKLKQHISTLDKDKECCKNKYNEE